MTISWPPTLADYKSDQKLDPADTEHDGSFQRMLDAAVVVVEGIRSDLNFAFDVLVDKPFPGADIYLGTIRLASRWYQRGDTPQGLMQLNDLGIVKVAAFDPDIERLLGIGRYRGPLFA